jgi:predicted DNA-binding transcriptional regulator YafY
LAIKEFKYRWYLFGQDISNNKIKCYGLDRMFNLQLSKSTFESPTNFNLAEDLKFCFGIVSPNAEKPNDIILSFEPLNGKYIKTLPLHHTQQILLDNDTELRISLQLYLTDDFIMELLSYGDSVKVIEPQKLIDTLKLVYQKALKKY